MGETQDPMLGRMLNGTILVRRQIGSGGMGNVYEGYQEHLDRVVAVKVLTPEHARNPLAAEYFLREARSASGLRHPNIIQIIDYGTEDDGTLFLAMEYVPGQPLSRILCTDFPIPTSRIVAILEQTLAGLTEAHRKQIVHRDLKPDNLMIETIDQRDFVKILDFGIAQSRAPERKVGPLTRQGAVVGTPQYMSPEQAAGDPIDTRSDLFSLGVILYEMLAGTAPFGGNSLPEILVSVMRDHPPPPSAANPALEVHPQLEAICLRAIKKEADLRYQSAEEFREALRTIDAVAAAPVGQPSPAQFILRSSKRKKSRPGSISGTLRRPQTTEEPPAERSTPSSGFTRGANSSGLNFHIDELRDDLLGERLHVVAVVVHQRSARRIDAEELIELRAMLDAALRDIAGQWRGTVQGRQGSFTTMLFGVPEPGRDDAQRAAQATLQLRKRLQSVAPQGTTFSFAIAEGEIFCPGQRLASAAGLPIDEATEAARDATDDNIVIASDGLGARLESVFRVSTIGHDGQRELVGPRDVVSVVDERRQASAGLVGRDHEIGVALGVLGRLGQKKGAIVGVIGEPGVGKSALIDEIVRLAETRKFRVARARARWNGPQLVRWIRLRWLNDLLRQYGLPIQEAEAAFREMGVAKEHARLLAAFLHDRMDRSFGRAGSARFADVEVNAEDALRVALRQLVRALTNQQPLIIAIDELDGFEGAIAEELRAWGEFVVDVPVLIVCGIRTWAGRSMEELPAAAVPVYLQPLDDDSARAFLRVRLQGLRNDQLLDRLVRVAAGFPLHLEHLARYAAQHPDMTVEEVETWLASSRDVGELLRLRLFELDKPTQNVLALLSALGDGTSGGALIDLASSDWEPMKVLGALHERGLVVVEGEEDKPRLYFRPPALRHVVYEQLSRKIRGRIHARAAAYYQEKIRAARDKFDQDDLVALAYHRERGGEYVAALEAIEVLVDHNMSHYEFAIARAHLLDAVRVLALAAPNDFDNLARLELLLIRTDVATGRRTEAIDRCRRLDRSGKLTPRMAQEVRVQLAELWLDDEDPDLVERIASGALAEIRKLQSASPDDIELRCLLVRALQTCASCHERAGRLVQAAQFAIEAADLIERGDIDPNDNPYGPAIVWETLNQLGRIRLRRSDSEGARKMFELALRIVTNAEDQRGELAVRANLASLLANEGHLDLAQQSLSASLHLARKLSDPRSIARLEHNRGLLLVRQRRVDTARVAFEQSLELSEDLDWREGIAMNIDRLRGLDNNQPRRDTKDRFPRLHED